MFPIKTIGTSAGTDREIGICSLGIDRADEVWHIPEETPVAFVFNQRNYAVMLATPHDIVDYAMGFSLTEGVVDSVEGILGLDIMYTELGVDLRLKIAEKFLERLDLRQRRRNLVGKAGCGICGLETADEFFLKLPVVARTRISLSGAVIEKAMDELSKHQPINQRTRSVHGAAWVSPDGDILQLREDVGRHNALDKLLGALAFANADIKAGFVLMSSRCSYELVEKAARRGVTALVSISGPTYFALRKAAEANMALYARGPSGIVELVG